MDTFKLKQAWMYYSKCKEMAGFKWLKSDCQVSGILTSDFSRQGGGAVR